MTTLAEPRPAADARPRGQEVVPAQLVPVRGVQFAVRIWGRGPPIYLVHGGPGASGAYWPQVLPPRLAESHTLVAVDLRGHGLSDRRGPYTVRALARDVGHLADALGHPRATLLGHSFGALVALEAALMDARFHRLVLVGGFPRTWRALADPAGWRVKARLALHLTRWNAQQAAGQAQPTRPFLRALLRQAEPLLHGPRTPPWSDDVLFRSVLDPLDAVVPLHKDLLRYDAWRRLPHLRARTLLLNGSHDRLAAPDAQAMAARIPDASLVEVEGAGHSPFVDAPDAFERALSAFLVDDGAVTQHQTTRGD